MQVPLFPLLTVLFPGGRLDLQIFEVRYLDMMNRCWRGGMSFGVCLLTQGSEVRRAGLPDEAFHRLGTLAVIDELSSPHPGLLLVRCRGTRRFSIGKREKAVNGAWSASVEALADDPRVAVPEHLQITAQGLARLLKQLSSRQQAGPLPSQADWQFDDCGWVANRWCELLPMPIEVKQQLLALDNPLLRLELVTDLLRQNDLGS